MYIIYKKPLAPKTRGIQNKEAKHPLAASNSIRVATAAFHLI